MQLSNDIVELVDTSRPALDDNDLLRQYRAGNDAAGKCLVDRHQERLVNALYWYTGEADPQAALAARVCTAALAEALTAATPGPFSVTLYRAMMKHVAVRERRPFRKLRRRYRKDAAGPASTQEREALVATLQELDTQWRLPFVLAVIACLPHVEIAAIAGVPPWTVKERLNEARRQVSSLLRQRGLR
jgi:DNA-directed RNA polymerase specialized sigma24 family protein